MWVWLTTIADRVWGLVCRVRSYSNSMRRSLHQTSTSSRKWKDHCQPWKVKWLLSHSRYMKSAKATRPMDPIETDTDHLVKPVTGGKRSMAVTSFRNSSMIFSAVLCKLVTT
jgi:hypothetical protein